MTKLNKKTFEEMIELLLKNDEERFFENEKDSLISYLWLRRTGWDGYEDWSYEELLEECFNREILERDE